MTVAGTTPYAWPYDGALVPTRTALVLLGPSGEPGPSSEPLGTYVRTGELAARLRDQGGVVVRVATTPASWPSREEPVADGADLRMTSYGVDGFYGSPLDPLLRSLGRDQLLLAGAWLETNVHSTMRSANDRGYECLLVLDACTAYDPALVAASRSQIEMSGGIFGAVGETAEVLAALAAVRPSERNPA